jgi:histone acetyltransferase (RNA polymerase elongator complex component)
MQKKHFTISIFIPQLACPFQCVYCNQRCISGRIKEPTEEEVVSTIEQHLSTIPDGWSEIEVGFFGGTFTGLPKGKQENYLKLVQPYIKKRKVQGIRISTRPDYIHADNLKLLKDHHVTTIELGAQSMDDEVLRLSGRGHTVEDTINASKLIRQNGFSLGLQMMLGLPGDTLERSIKTAEAICALKANNTRIYPALVINGTELKKLYHEKKYFPLSLEDAVEWAKEVYKVFDKNKVTVLRMGLHPSEGLISGESLAAGPFHISFGELVMTSLWKEVLEKIDKTEKENLVITVAPDQFNYAIGHKAENKKMLREIFRTVRFTTHDSLKGRNFYADHH